MFKFKILEVTSLVSLLLPLIYISFISLGIPDAVLGSVWPILSKELNLSVSYMGILTVIISGGTIASSLKSEFLVKKLGFHKIVYLSVFFTSIALLGYSISRSFLALCIFSIPYGLGAGSIDAALNNYVATNYESKHMNWLHCMWGVGATTGPYIMGFILSNNNPWNYGYFVLFALQFTLTILLIGSKKIWQQSLHNNNSQENLEHNSSEIKIYSLKNILKVSGVIPLGLAFFCFSGIEQAGGQWASTYLVDVVNITPKNAATFTSLFYLGITIGRLFCGFFSMKFSDKEMIFAGEIIVFIGILLITIFKTPTISLVGLGLIGLGTSPIFPAVIHMTPYEFNKKYSQGIIGTLMACAYCGTLILPPLLGIFCKIFSVGVYPIFLLFLLLFMALFFKMFNLITKNSQKNIN